MSKAVLTGQLHASTSPGGQKHLMLTSSMNEDLEVTAGEMTLPPGRIDYVNVSIETADRIVKSTFPPENARSYRALQSRFEGYAGALAAMMACNVPATFVAQEWEDDYAVDVDSVEFNAIPALLKMKLEDVQVMFARGVDFDALANHLDACESHDGPFKVEIDEADLTNMVCLLSDFVGALDKCTMAEVTPAMWDDFTIAAHAIQSTVARNTEALLASAPVERPRG